VALAYGQYLSVDRIRTPDEARRGAETCPASVPELVEAGLRSRSAGQGETPLPKTTTEDRVSPRRAFASRCDLERDIAY
jgi:hypothetical protein